MALDPRDEAGPPALSDMTARWLTLAAFLLALMVLVPSTIGGRAPIGSGLVCGAVSLFMAWLTVMPQRDGIRLVGALGVVVPGVVLSRGMSNEPLEGLLVFASLAGGGILGVLLAPMLTKSTTVRPWRTDPEAFLAAVGAWLTFIGAARITTFVCLLGAPVASAAEARTDRWAAGAALVALVGGGVLTAAAVAMRKRRHAWLARVVAGVVPGWRILPGEGPNDHRGVPAFSDLNVNGAVALLVRDGPTATPFRQRDEVIARVDARYVGNAPHKPGGVALVIPAVVTLGVTTFMFFALSFQLREDQLARAYARLPRGASREVVLATMGRPDTTGPCRGAITWDAEPIAQNHDPDLCVEQWRYAPPRPNHTKVWTVSFDRAGRAVSKHAREVP